MKLYDVIRKDQKERGLPDPKPVTPDVPVPQNAPLKKKHRLPEYPVGNRRISWRKIIIIAAALVVIAILYLIGALFVHAKVVVTERQIPFSLQNTPIDLTNSTVADPGRLSFQTMIVTDTVSRQVFASAMTTSTTKATGEAVIFNQYSKGSQTVRSGTVLTGANNEKYLTKSTITVPGYTGSGSNKIPGSASVDIVAASAGSAYNSTGTTFIVSGWSGANAKLFFSSSAGAISGGQNGAMETLNDSDKQQTLATLQAALSEKLSRETSAQIPSNLITFPDMQFITINADSLVVSGTTPQFPATLQGTMVSYLIPRDLFEQAIAAKAITDQVYPEVTIPALGAIQVEPLSAIPTDPKNTPDTITVAVSGQGVIIPQVTPGSIQQAVAGISRRSFNTIISAIPEIDTAKYTLYPFWSSYFPYKQSRINVQIQ